MTPQSPSSLDSVLAAGSMSPTVRPKSRFIDRVLEEQRGREQNKAQTDLATMMSAVSLPSPQAGTTAGMFGGNPGRRER